MANEKSAALPSLTEAPQLDLHIKRECNNTIATCPRQVCECAIKAEPSSSLADALRAQIEMWRQEAANYEPDISEAEAHGLLVTAASAAASVGQLRECADELAALLARDVTPETTKEPTNDAQRFIESCAKEGMYRELVEAIGDALDGQLSDYQATWFPCARGVQQQREALDKCNDQLAPSRDVTPGEGSPQTICLSGSSRFIGEMAVVAWELEKRGHVTMHCNLLPGWYTQTSHHLAEEQGVAERLDAVHLRKIDLADELLVIDIAGYIGESTRREIDYATSRGKRVVYLSNDATLLKAAIPAPAEAPKENDYDLGFQAGYRAALPKAPETTADFNDGATGEAAYCHHRHHLDDHATDFDTCPNSICVNARRVAASSPLPAPENEEMDTAWAEAIRVATMFRIAAFDHHGEIISLELRGRSLDQMRGTIHRTVILSASQPTAPATPPKPCANGHEWSNQYGDDYKPDDGTRCDCGQKVWGRGRHVMRY